MGRTIPPSTVLIFKLVKDMKPFYRAVRLPDQLELDDMFESIVQYRSAIANTGTIYPIEVMLASMVLQERKRAKKDREELSGRIDHLFGVVMDLSKRNLTEHEQMMPEFFGGGSAKREVDSGDG